MNLFDTPLGSVPLALHRQCDRSCRKGVQKGYRDSASGILVWASGCITFLRQFLSSHLHGKLGHEAGRGVSERKVILDFEGWLILIGAKSQSTLTYARSRKAER